MVLLNAIRTALRCRSATGLTAALSFALLHAGCAAPRQTNPPGDPDKLSDAAFQGYLQTVPVVTVAEAVRAIDILVNADSEGKTFEERRQRLISQGIAKAEWNLQPQNMIDAGAVGYMIFKACQMRGGVCYTLFGSWGLGDRRYALRELAYQEMIEDLPDYQYLQGSTLVALLSKADEKMAAKGLYHCEKLQLTDEQDRDAAGNLVVPPPAKSGP